MRPLPIGLVDTDNIRIRGAKDRVLSLDDFVMAASTDSLVILHRGRIIVERYAEDQSLAATRVTLRPHDPGTGEEIDKREVVKGYEYARGEFVTFTAEELKALDVESSKVSIWRSLCREVTSTRSTSTAHITSFLMARLRSKRSG